MSTYVPQSHGYLMSPRKKVRVISDTVKEVRPQINTTPILLEFYKFFSDPECAKKQQLDIGESFEGPIHWFDGKWSENGSVQIENSQKDVSFTIGDPVDLIRFIAQYYKDLSNLDEYTRTVIKKLNSAIHVCYNKEVKNFETQVIMSEKLDSSPTSHVKNDLEEIFPWEDGNWDTKGFVRISNNRKTVTFTLQFGGYGEKGQNGCYPIEMIHFTHQWCQTLKPSRYNSMICTKLERAIDYDYERACLRFHNSSWGNGNKTVTTK